MGALTFIGICLLVGFGQVAMYRLIAKQQRQPKGKHNHLM